MMRIARVVPMLFAFTLCSASMLRAQPAASTEMPGYAEFNAGATLGHKSDLSVGGEAGWAVMSNLDIFVEGGHIGNAASADMEANATKIASNVGATSSVVSKVNYFDAGVRYRIAATPTVHPYIAVGFGAARVTNETTLSVNGTVTPPGNLGVQFGSDLSGTETSPFLLVGGGVSVSFASRYFADVSYRYGRVFPKTDENGNSFNELNTNRVQVGIGIKF